MFWQVEANIFFFQTENQDVKKGKPGLHSLQKLAGTQGVCYEENLWGMKNDKYIRRGKLVDLGFDFCFQSALEELPIEPSARVKGTRGVRRFLPAEERKEEKTGCHRGAGGRTEREGGQVGIVSPVPLSIHSHWFFLGLLGGGTVTEEGVRNVSLLRGYHLQTEGSFVRCARRGEGFESAGISGGQHSPLNTSRLTVVKAMGCISAARGSRMPEDFDLLVTVINKGHSAGFCDTQTIYIGGKTSVCSRAELLQQPSLSYCCTTGGI